jgi:hypothetical protein
VSTTANDTRPARLAAKSLAFITCQGAGTWTCSVRTVLTWVEGIDGVPESAGVLPRRRATTAKAVRVSKPTVVSAQSPNLRRLFRARRCCGTYVNALPSATRIVANATAFLHPRGR